jgi:AcrR family transcriptional regulator
MSTRPRDSVATKEAIRAAARERFAADGYEKATIRAIAADAGIDPSMVMRYFGNKEGLLAAAADFDLRMPDLSHVPVDTVGSRMAEHFLDRWKQDDAFTALLHAAVTHHVARDRLLDIFQTQVASVVEKLAPDKESAPARAGLIASQVLGTALCRYVLLLPQVVAMPRAELITWLGDTLQHYLTAPTTPNRGD